jgi:hypothetical protein
VPHKTNTFPVDVEISAKFHTGQNHEISHTFRDLAKPVGLLLVYKVGRSRYYLHDTQPQLYTPEPVNPMRSGSPEVLAENFGDFDFVP